MKKTPQSERPTIPAFRFTDDTVRMKRDELNVLLTICQVEKKK